jgi:hypothetical protein
MGLISGTANPPVLTPGWTPVNYAGTGHEFSTASSTTQGSNGWKYNYDPVNSVNGVGPKQWANAKDTKGNLWVWIPRFSYRATQFADDPEIKIRFSNGTIDNTASIDGRTCKTHKAFTFGTTELAGIWVPKYAAYNDSANGNIPGFKPSQEAWRSITVNDIFTKCLDLKNHITTAPATCDGHMLKNSEWGASGMLAKAVGNARPERNSDNTYKTGYGLGSGSTTTSLDTTGAASTTGNVTGIFDMVGNTYEYVASYVNNGHGNLNTYCASLVAADDKYKDVFPKGTNDDQATNYSAATGMTDGMMIHETSTDGSGSTSWKNWSNVAANSYFPYSGYPVFLRGGYYSSSYAGLSYFYNNTGNAYSNYGFRACFVNLNSAPLISGEDANLGDKTTSFTVDYTVDDPDLDDVLTITEKVDDIISRTINEAVRDQTYILDLSLNWAELSLGEHEVIITVNDGKGGSATRTYTFAKVDDRVKFELKNPIETSLMAKRIVISGITTIPTEATLKIEACNNAFDVAPTWEDITQKFLDKESYSFINGTKTADKWGINVRFEILKNDATEQIIVNGFGFAFD